MVKILVLSDTHYENDIMTDIVKHYEGKVDYMIHCGDSSLDCDDPLMAPFDVVVKGNHDYDDYPRFVVLDHIFITHGHFFDIYHGYKKLIDQCHQYDCFICLHGHTHVATYNIIDNIHFINPGSVMMNRGEYGYGTYVILTIDGHDVQVDYHHHVTHEIVTEEVLKDGKRMMEEINALMKKIDAQMAKLNYD
ncbi:MAG: YfcE family phosphodiesterase [Erysipelotrichaceae bacterium]|nr:YfcE family phosphodiesterase [Erysipelotrichaceae bacterium]